MGLKLSDCAISSLCFYCLFKKMLFIHGNCEFHIIQMRNSNMKLTILALLASCVLSTVIITSGPIKQYDIGHGTKMITFGNDVRQDDSSEDLSERIQPAQTIQINPPPSDSPASTISNGHPSYKNRKRVQFFSNFGCLGKRSDEDTYRSLIYSKNKKWMQEQNKVKNLTFTLDENQFSTLTVQEFSSLYLTLTLPKHVPNFAFDIMKEIKRFRRETDDLIERFFGFSHGKKRNFNFIPVSPTPTPTPTPSTSPTPSNSPSVAPNSFNFTDTSNSSSSTNSSNQTSSNSSTNSDVSLDIDWTVNGTVTSVKDQGSCGSCYSFATQATIQSAYLLINKSAYATIDLSEQQIVDCSGEQGNKGCNGGWLSNVYDYVIKYGTTSEDKYPYTQVNASCKVTGGGYKISRYQGGALANCSALAAMVAGRPVAVAVSAGNQYWQNYKAGIMNQCSGNLDHGVAVVGVFQNSTHSYWKIRNSWGASWGEDGYMRLDRTIDSGNLCLICSHGYYPEI